MARERLLDRTATAFLLVVNADKLSILESRRVGDLLARFGVGIQGVVVNRVLPGTAGGEFLAARRAQESAYRAEIDQLFARLPRVAVPLLERDVHGAETLRRVGAALRCEWAAGPAVCAVERRGLLQGWLGVRRRLAGWRRGQRFHALVSSDLDAWYNGGPFHGGPDLNPWLAVAITGVVAFALHILFVLAVRNR